LFAGFLALTFGLSGCAKEPVKITSVEIVTDMDRGSGNFNRVLRICFDKPIQSDYYHTMHLVTNEDFKLSGGSWIRPRASDPKNKCQLRNLYLYLGKNDPPGSRPLIDEYVRPGNVRQLMIRIYAEEPTSDKERPMEERIFSNI
jgi:hypothetical protein